ncbi:MAG: hypothetical protein ACJ76H_12520 [Bacteriovoracaceae bacterium]
MKILNAAFLFITLMSTAIAGDKGNIYRIPQPYEGLYGGDAVVCRNPNNQIIRARLLDYVEADKFYPDLSIHFMTGINDLTYFELLATKLVGISPDVFVTFRRESKKLALRFSEGTIGYQPHPDYVFVKDFKLLSVPDLGLRKPIAVAKGCKIEQLVIRYKRFDRTTYYIQSELFNKLSPVDRRGLMLHEALYHTFNLYYGDHDSARTRFFNRGIVAKPLNELTPDYLEKLLQNAYVHF